MGKIVRIKTPVSEDEVRDLEIGDTVYISGTIYTMRDQAHHRAFELSDRNDPMPVDLRNGAVWHCGPIVRKTTEGWELVSAGSTTSYRFTEYEPRLFREFGPRLIIGKGGMGKETVQAMKEYGAAYLAGVGGCAALYAEQVKRVKNVFWTDLGLPEAIWVLEVENFGALITAIDSKGRSLYERAKQKVGERYRKLAKELAVDPDINYTYWPPRRTSTSEVAGYFSNEI